MANHTPGNPKVFESNTESVNLTNQILIKFMILGIKVSPAPRKAPEATMEAANKINDAAKFSDSEFDYVPIRFTTVDTRGNAVSISRQQYKKQLQKYYWRIIFNKLNMDKYATNGLREQINKFVEKQVNVPFTMRNIYQVINMVVQTTGQRMDKALLEAFDLICSLSAENSTAGEKWKTNSNYMINRKFIVHYMTDYDARYSISNEYIRLDYSGNATRIEDVIKALCYITETNYDEITNLRDFVYKNHLSYGTWYDWSFFSSILVEFYR